MKYLTAAHMAPEQPQRYCSIMDLPTEMPIAIYNFALQHILDEIYDAAPADKRLSHAVKKPRGDPDGVPPCTSSDTVDNTPESSSALIARNHTQRIAPLLLGPSVPHSGKQKS